MRTRLRGKAGKLPAEAQPGASVKLVKEEAADPDAVEWEDGDYMDTEGLEDASTTAPLSPATMGSPAASSAPALA